MPQIRIGMLPLHLWLANFESRPVFSINSTNVIMVLILDGNSEMGAHVRSNLLYVICIIHLIRARAVTNRILFFSEKTYFSSYVRNMF